MSPDASDWEFYLRKSVIRPFAPFRPSASPPPSAHLPVRQLVRSSALLPAPVCLSAYPSIVCPRPLVRLACPASSAHLPIRSSARPPLRPTVCSSARSPRPLVHPSAHLSACPPTPSAPSASFHPWSLAYKFLAVEAERAPSVCRAPLLEECPQHHGHKGDPGVTPGTCGTIGERAQVILV